jgi:outer membrane protein assembly factor BamA
VKPGFEPFLWSLESAALVTFKPADAGGVVVPYTDVFVKWTLPRLFGAPIRLEVRPSFTAETTILYYGIGNQVPKASVGEPASYTTFKRAHPALEVAARFLLFDHLTARAGVRYAQDWLSAAPDSKLALDMASGSTEVRRLLGSTAAHAVLLLQTGLQWDTRDNEASTHSGALCSADLRVSPGGGGEFLYRYGEASLNLRAFVPLLLPQLTLAVRLVAHGLFGDVPFYELSRFDDTYALGGTNGVRGVPAGLLWGKAKLFGNVELRGELARFHALGKALLFGAAFFFDAGRLWAGFSSQPELDGSGLGLHYGAGGGLRLQSGSAFVLRADVAWSPDASPVGGYFSAGQLF